MKILTLLEQNIKILKNNSQEEQIGRLKALPVLPRKEKLAKINYKIDLNNQAITNPVKVCL